MMYSATWLRQRHRRVMRGLRTYFGVQLVLSVGGALLLYWLGERPVSPLIIVSGILIGLLLLPQARRWLSWLYIPSLLLTDLVHVTALLWLTPADALQRGSLWALAYIPLLVAAGRWWSYSGGAMALIAMLIADAAVLFGRLAWRDALPVFIFQAVTAALGTWAAAHNEWRTRRDLLHSEAFNLSESRVKELTKSYQQTIQQLQSLREAPEAMAIDQLRQQLHRSLRSVGGLPLAQRTLPEALAAELRTLKTEGNLNINFTCDGHLPVLSPTATAYLWRAAQELLSNVREHAQAQQLNVELYGDDAVVVLQVRDDGVGFDPEQLRNDHHYSSLAALATQAEMHRGSFELQSVPQQGTTITLRVEGQH
ncbi:sensor histidine kinase [Herpetosiphon llansteffanensis]|uniref:sensor histidine kinase n=1 Tax=Herpetosiphon llansteffanensis TaxID=2094568 RepID=UPI000D7C6898|nr:ATP-binding protein [Herpetosiphon llansteffanensis]